MNRASYGPREALVESWPATAGVELGGGLVKGSSTARAVVHAIAEELVVFSSASVPSKWGFRREIRPQERKPRARLTFYWMR